MVTHRDKILFELKQIEGRLYLKDHLGSWVLLVTFSSDVGLLQWISGTVADCLSFVVHKWEMTIACRTGVGGVSTGGGCCPT